jgi:hypothetical protein
VRGTIVERFLVSKKNLSSIIQSLRGQRRRCQDLSIEKKGSRIDYSTAPPSRVITHGTPNKLSQLKHVAPSSSGCCCLKSRKSIRNLLLRYTQSALPMHPISTHAERKKPHAKGRPDTCFSPPIHKRSPWSHHPRRPSAGT